MEPVIPLQSAYLLLAPLELRMHCGSYRLPQLQPPMAQKRPGDPYIPADVAVVVPVAAVGDDGVRVARDSDLLGIRGAVLVVRVVAGVVGGVVGVVWGVFMGHRQTDQDEGEAGCACCAQRVLHLRVLRDDYGDSATGVGVGEHEVGRGALRLNCLLIRQLLLAILDPIGSHYRGGSKSISPITIGW